MTGSRTQEQFQTEKQVFAEHLQRANLKRTAQRDLIFEIFLLTEEHLSSEDLYRLVQKEDETVGHTTVYRTLKLLTEAGLAREVRFGDGKTYYEHHYNHEHHDHMICTECGKVIEFFSPELEAMQDSIAEKFGFKLTHHNLRILGVCADCQTVKSEPPPTSAASGAQPRVKVAARQGKQL